MRAVKRKHRASCKEMGIFPPCSRLLFQPTQHMPFSYRFHPHPFMTGLRKSVPGLPGWRAGRRSSTCILRPARCPRTNRARRALPANGPALTYSLDCQLPEGRLPRAGPAEAGAPPERATCPGLFDLGLLAQRCEPGWGLGTRARGPARHLGGPDPCTLPTHGHIPSSRRVRPGMSP